MIKRYLNFANFLAKRSSEISIQNNNQGRSKSYQLKHFVIMLVNIRYHKITASRMLLISDSLFCSLTLRMSNTPFTRYNLLSKRLNNRLDNKLDVRLNDATGCPVVILLWAGKLCKIGLASC